MGQPKKDGKANQSLKPYNSMTKKSKVQHDVIQEEEEKEDQPDSL